MRRQLETRLKKIEQRLFARRSRSMLAVLPEWLMNELRSQGMKFLADGRPDLR